MKNETAIVSKDQLSAFVKAVPAGLCSTDDALWDAFKTFVRSSQLNELMEAWKNCEDKDGSGVVSIRALAKELGLT